MVNKQKQKIYLRNIYNKYFFLILLLAIAILNNFELLNLFRK